MKASRKYTILIVDDIPENLRSLASIVRKVGEQLEVLTALNGKVALDIAREELPNLIITDWEMPEMDGIELIKLLAADPTTMEIPVIMCTGIMTTSDHLATALDAGAVDFIRKPVDEIELRARLQSMLQLSDSFQTIRHEVQERKKTESKLREALDRAEMSEKAKEQFLANMSHEIRTPLNAIIGFAEVLQKEALSDKHREFVEMINLSGENLLVIINDILDFSKIEAGKLDIESIDFNISKSYQTCQLMLEPKANEKGLKFTVFKDPEIPNGLIGDPTRLNQILINLVNNAIKFTEKGTVSVTAKLLKKEADLVYIETSISDTGIGIPEDKIATIFDSFSQVSADTTRKFGGTGLGTSIVKRLVDLQGGTVGIESTFGEGSTFKVTLPYRISEIQPEDGELLEDESEKTQVGSDVLSGKRVLLADDNKINQRLAGEVLTDFGLDIDYADNGLMVLEKFKKDHFDLILMDVQMPEMDGLTATEKIRNTFPPEKKDVPIVAMTAHALKQQVDDCFAAGMNDHVSKPFRQADLFGTLVKFIGGDEQGNPFIERTVTADSEVPKEKDTQLNLSSLEDIANGNTAFVVEVLGMIYRNTQADIDKVEQKLLVGDWSGIGAIAHKTQGGLTCLGQTEVRDLFVKLETAVDEKKGISTIFPMFQALKNAWVPLQLQIAEHLQEKKAILQ